MSSSILSRSGTSGRAGEQLLAPHLAPAALACAVRRWLEAMGASPGSIRSVSAETLEDVDERWGVERRGVVRIHTGCAGDTKLQHRGGDDDECRCEVTLTNADPVHYDPAQTQRLVVTPAPDDDTWHDDGAVVIATIELRSDTTHFLLWPPPAPRPCAYSHVALVA